MHPRFLRAIASGLVCMAALCTAVSGRALADPPAWSGNIWGQHAPRRPVPPAAPPPSPAPLLHTDANLRTPAPSPDPAPAPAVPAAAAPSGDLASTPASAEAQPALRPAPLVLPPRPNPRRTPATAQIAPPGQALAAAPAAAASSALRASPATPFDLAPRPPQADAASYVDARASVIGDVRIAERVYVAPFASLRADGGAPVAIGAASNVQDGVVIHGLPAHSSGTPIPGHTIDVGGIAYSVLVGSRVSLDHQAQIHGPAWIEDGAWIGMQSLVSNARVGADAVLEPRSAVIGVQIAPGRLVPAGTVITTQEAADQLPELAPDDPRRAWGRTQVDASTALAAELLQGASR